MTGKMYDAYFSTEAIKHRGFGSSLNVYKDDSGKEYVITLVIPHGNIPNSGWSDLTFLGVVTEWSRTLGNSVEDKALLLASYDAVNMKYVPKFAANNSVNKPVVAKAINDYVCPACSNDKCSKTEKSCWKCGFKFQGN